MLNSTLCKKCAAKERLPKPNPLIDHGGIVITKAVEERLRRQANYNIPYRIKDYIGQTVFCLSCPVIAYLFFTGIDYLELIQTMGVLSGTYALQLFLGRERSAKVNLEVKQLAEKRERKLHDTRTFYASAEWRKVRTEIIREHKNICKNCRRTIKRKVDVTVDHIKPRSKFPELALHTNNLRVLCRKCNSAKGAKCIDGLVA